MVSSISVERSIAAAVAVRNVYLSLSPSLYLLLVCIHATALTGEVLPRGRAHAPPIANRAACGNNDILLALKANSAFATLFPCSLIDIPGSTVYKSFASVKAIMYRPPMNGRRSSIALAKPFCNCPYRINYSTTSTSNACALRPIILSTSETASSPDAYNLKLKPFFSTYDCCYICDTDGAEAGFSSCVGGLSMAAIARCADWTVRALHIAPLHARRTSVGGDEFCI